MEEIMDCGNSKEYIGKLTICQIRCETCLLGEGRSMVFRAKYNEEGTDQVMDVAAKEVKKKIIAEEVAMLKLANGHNNILKYFSTEQHPSSVNGYIVTEYCHGNLTDLIVGTFRQEYFNYTKFKMIYDIASGLVHLHQNGIIHRDLKPENILFKRINHSEVVLKLADFGISRQGDANRVDITMTAMQGTPLWQAPEMCGTDFVDRIRTAGFMLDLFPLGCIIIYILLDGRYAFGRDREQYKRRLQEEKPKILDDVEELLRSRYEQPYALVKEMFSKDPYKRPNAVDVLNKVEIFKLCVDLTPGHFDQPAPQIKDNTLVTVKDLDLSYSKSDSWLIKVRVTRKSKILSSTTAKNVKRIEMDLLDGSGRISAVAFGPNAFHFNDLMKEQSIYTIRHSDIKEAYRPSSEIPHHFEIVLGDSTKVDEMLEERNFPDLNFTPLRDLQFYKEKYVSSLNIEAHVASEGMLEDYSPRNLRTNNLSEENKKKVLHLVDHTNTRTVDSTKVSLTLYGPDAYMSWSNKRVQITDVKIDTHGHKTLKTTQRSKLNVVPSKLALSYDEENKENIMC